MSIREGKINKVMNFQNKNIQLHEKLLDGGY